MVRLYFSLAFLVACTLCGPATAQDRIPDSLRVLLQNGRQDTDRVTALLSVGDHYSIRRPDSAVFYFESARALAQRLHWPRGIAAYDSHIIQVLNDRGDYQGALRLCLEAIRIYADSGTREDRVRAYNNVANEYQYLGDLNAAVDNYVRSMQLAETLTNRKYMKILSNNLASVFYELQQYDKCYTYALQAYHIASELKDTEGVASSLVNLGLSEGHLNRNDSAIKHFREIIQVGRRLDDYTLVCDAYVNMASIFVRQHRAAVAGPEFDSVLILADKHSNPNYRMLALAGLADVAMEGQQWAEADRDTKRAMEIAGRLRDRDDLVQLYDKEANIREKMSDWKGALAYRNRFDLLNDSLLNEKTRDHINDLETKYQAAKKDHALAEQRFQLEQTRETVRKRNTQLYILAGGLAALLILLLLAWRLFRQRQKLNRQALVTLQKEQEVAVLKAVLQGQEQERQRIARELHDDMGAGLTTILYLSRRNDAGPVSPTDEKIARTATGLVDTMNEIIWSMNQQYDTLEDLVAFIRRQSSLLLENNDIDYRIEIPDQVPDVRIGGEVRRNVFLVVKEALNNALKHSAASLIRLRIDVDSSLHIRIQDNGRGMPAEDPHRIAGGGSPADERRHQHRKGNGLGNMRQRMDKTGGAFSIVSDNGTTVELSVPL
ncbi:MAG TPA: tetratricopeptide repeat protein [Puia sp.]|nr:tetratricopeptide repeat protein [Puia sp.]